MAEIDNRQGKQMELIGYGDNHLKIGAAMARSQEACSMKYSEISVSAIVLNIIADESNPSLAVGDYGLRQLWRAVPLHIDKRN